MPTDPLVLGALLIVAAVVVGVLLRQRGEGVTRVATPSTPAGSPAPVDRSDPAQAGDMEADIRSLLAQRRKIEAVKLVRERTGLGLKEAKEYVEAVERGQSPIAPAAPPPPTPMAPETLDDRVRDLLARGQKIVAVKLVREQTGRGLKESLDYVEQIERG